MLAEVAAGTLATPEDAVFDAINQAKQRRLRERLTEAFAEGGESSADDVRKHVRQDLDRLAPPRGALSATSLFEASRSRLRFAILPL